MTDRKKNYTQKIADLYAGFGEDLFNTRTALKFSNIYGEYGEFFMTYITPVLWIVPFFFTISVIIVFKKGKLLGPSQRILIGVMSIDVLFSLLTGIRDGYLYLTEMNYGFVEYKICRPLLYSFAVLKMIHGTSSFLRSLLTTRNMLLFLFPMKYRILVSKFKRFTIVCLFFHLCACSSMFSYPSVIPLQPVRIVQTFKNNRPLKIISTCVTMVELSMENLSWFEFVQSLVPLTIAIQLGYFALLPILVQLINVTILIVVMRKHNKTIDSLMHGLKGTGAVKYLRLLKVTIILGISFFLQELPPAIFQVLVTYYYNEEDATNMNATFLLYQSISFAVTKPLDIIIYASQSQAFRRQVLKMLDLQK